MTRETSIYLDCVRFLAALTVFACHLSVFGGLYKPMGIIGPPAVIVFFVLSGYVIGHVVDAREQDVRSYVISRAARLYSVVLPALIVTAVLDRIGASFDPGLYTGFQQMIGPGAWRLLFSAAFLNEAWGANVFPGSNWAFWSMSFEVVFYALFGVFWFARGPMRVSGCVAVAAVAGPRILGLFPLWLLGFAAHMVARRRMLSRRIAGAGLWGSFLLLPPFFWWLGHAGLLRTESYIPTHDAWETLHDYGLGLLIAINLACFAIAPGVLGPVMRVIGPVIRPLAASTFTLYLVHCPVIICVRAAAPIPHNSRWFDLCLIAVPLAVVYLLSIVTEHRKDTWRRMVGRCLPRGWFNSATA